MVQKSSKTLKSGLTALQKNKPAGRTVTIRITVEAETWRTAAGITGERARLPLEAVLVAFIGELAEFGTRPAFPWSENLVAMWLLTRDWPRLTKEDKTCR